MAWALGIGQLGMGMGNAGNAGKVLWAMRAMCIGPCGQCALGHAGTGQCALGHAGIRQFVLCMIGHWLGAGSRVEVWGED